MDTPLDVLNSFLYKKLRKSGYTSDVTGRSVSKINCALTTIYNMNDLLTSCKEDLEVLYWVLDKMYEDWLVLLEVSEVGSFQYKVLDEKALRIIENVIHNLKTGLGKKTEYTHTYDPTLINPVNRKPVRDIIGYKEKEYLFDGLDIWNGYELSHLLLNGKPNNFMLRLGYDCKSESIVESKSLKLYFNSFNQTNITEEDLLNTIKKDLEIALKTNTIVVEKIETDFIRFYGQDEEFTNIDILSSDKYEYEYNPTLLKTIEYSAKQYNPIMIRSGLLRSRCRQTGQPDWGTVYIQYEPKSKILDNIALLQYIVSYRNHREFHEECCERMIYDISKILDPKWLKIELHYTRRGGIDISPLRIWDPKNVYQWDFQEEYKSFLREFNQ